MSPNSIDAALERHLLTLPGAPPIAWEDVSYTPTTGQAYLQVNQLRNNPIDHGIANGLREDRGILQITVVHPAGGGKVAALSLAHKVASHFPRLLRLSAADGVISIYKSPSVASGLPDDGWYRVPISISWRAH